MLINKKAVNLFTLSVAEDRSRKFKRVSGAFYIRCEAALQTFIRDAVKRHPSKGQTIQ